MSHDKKLTTRAGCPVAHNQNVMTTGPRGPQLLQDVWFLEKLAHFDREVIPERRMHAKGSGTYGTFTVTHDITRYTRAKIFLRIGKITELFARFTNVAGEHGAADAAKVLFHPFGLNKIWPHQDYPLLPVGVIELNRNPKNFFAEVEQSAFNPAHIVPGIGFSPDKMLQGRLFSYGNAQRYRLGVNHHLISVNAPRSGTQLSPRWRHACGWQLWWHSRLQTQQSGRMAGTARFCRTTAATGSGRRSLESPGRYRLFFTTRRIVPLDVVGSASGIIREYGTRYTGCSSDDLHAAHPPLPCSRPSLWRRRCRCANYPSC